MRPNRVLKNCLVVFISLTALCFALPHWITKATASKGSASPKQTELARMSEQVSIHAAGKGNPYINLSDGREVITAYEGPQELMNALENNQAKPLSLASADFDEDGVPDLVSGYAGP